MKTNQKIITTIKTKGNSLPVLDTVIVKDRKLTTTNLCESTIINNVDIKDGVYDGFLFSKGILMKSDIDIDQFPKINFESLNEKFELKRNVIEALYLCLKYVGKDQLRPVMTGVFIDENGVCATNAHKLYYDKIDTGVKTPMILTVKTVMLMYYFDSDLIVDHDINSEIIKFHCEKYTGICRLIDGKYPNFHAVIPKEKSITVQLIRTQLLKQLKDLKWVTNSTTGKVTFLFSKNNLNISVNNEDNKWEKQADIICFGFDTNEKFKISFDIRILISIITGIKDDVLKFEMSESNKAALINEKSLVMPITTG